VKLTHAAAGLIIYLVGWIHAVSCIIRIGRVKSHPIFPGQVWDLPGVGNVVIINTSGSYTYYEIVEDRDQTWYCRTSTFRQYATIVANIPKPSPLTHLFDASNDNVVHLKREDNND